MDKPRLIDADKILTDLKAKKRELRGSLNFAKQEGETTWADDLREQMEFLTLIIEHIEKGGYKPDPIPLPTIKPGDSVTHKDLPLYGKGTVIAIAKSGKRARCEFPNAVGMWGSPIDAYYLIDKLEVVE
ncbi:hypothetical protein D3C72_247260 [compost metagenome]